MLFGRRHTQSRNECLASPSRAGYRDAKPGCTRLHTTTIRSGNRHGVGRIYSAAVCTGAIGKRIEGNPDARHASTSFVERSNLSIRMGNRRMTRLANAFSKKAENHAHKMAVYFMHYSFVRIHQTLKITPAMAAKVTPKLWEMSDMVKVLEEWETQNSG
jgi:hypothetical protein